MIEPCTHIAQHTCSPNGFVVMFAAIGIMACIALFVRGVLALVDDLS